MMKMLLLVLSLLISTANCHFNYNRIAASSHSSDPAASSSSSSYYNNQQQQPLRQPTYHYYPMTFFSKSPYTYDQQTTSKPYYATASSLAIAKNPNPAGIPHWYRQSASTYYDRPSYNYQFLGPQTVDAEDRSLYSTPELVSPLVSPAELAGSMEQVLELKVTDSAQLLTEEEASGDESLIQSDDTSISTTDAITELEISTESNVEDSTDSLDDEGLLVRSTAATEEEVETIASLAEESVTDIEVETTTMLNDDITTSVTETESTITLERHQSIIPFYLRPSAWRSRSFGPDPRYYQPNHYYGPEEARDFPSSQPASFNLFL